MPDIRKSLFDGREVVAERWRTAWNPNDYKTKVRLEKGKRYPIRIEWLPDGGVSYLGLKVLSPLPEAEQNRLAFWSEMGDPRSTITSSTVKTWMT